MTRGTKERIVQTAARLFHVQGYHATGLQQILQEAGVPKGSFYFHFKSKQDLALATLDFFGQVWAGVAQGFLEDPDQPPLERVRRLFAWYRRYFSERGYTGGCPVGNLGQEMGDLSPEVGQVVAASVEAMAGRLAKTLEQALELGQLPPGQDPRRLAFFIISSWQGALIRMKACKCEEPLVIFEETVFDGLLA